VTKAKAVWYACCADCRYGFGVGGEYPLASSSAAERSQADDQLRHRRGEQVVMVYSGQVRERCMCIFHPVLKARDASGDATQALASALTAQHTMFVGRRAHVAVVGYCLLLCRQLLLCVLLCVLQGMGNLVNGCIILMCMAMFSMTGALLMRPTETGKPADPVIESAAKWAKVLAGNRVLLALPGCSLKQGTV
jgi:hypothetical protein